MSHTGKKKPDVVTTPGRAHTGRTCRVRPWASSWERWGNGGLSALRPMVASAPCSVRSFGNSVDITGRARRAGKREKRFDRIGSCSPSGKSCQSEIESLYHPPLLESRVCLCVCARFVCGEGRTLHTDVYILHPFLSLRPPRPTRFRWKMLSLVCRQALLANAQKWVNESFAQCREAAFYIL